MQIRIVGVHRWRTFAVFNGNAFPPEMRSFVDACGSRLALLFHHASLLPVALRREAEDFRESIEEQRADLEAGLRGRPDLSSVAVYDGMGCTSELHNALYAMKSFLDLYAKLVGKLINSGNQWSFSKANINGRKLSGGRFINALRSSGPTGGHGGLADLTVDHSERWITEAVAYRDQLSHRSDLDHMIPMHLPLYAEAPHVRFDEMMMPRMPNGIELEKFVTNLGDELAQYVSASIRMVPNVDQSLISQDGLISGADNE